MPALRRSGLLSFTVGSTVVLLIFSAALFVLGIFNETLRWDIFGPRVEAILYGVFGSTVSLAAVGVAMTLVLGVREVVASFRNIERARAAGAEAPAATRSYRGAFALVVVVLVMLVGGLAWLNRRITEHRNGVFQRLAAEQMEHFGEKLRAVLPASVPGALSTEGQDLLATLERLSFVSDVELVLPDPADESAIWVFRDGYSSSRAAWRADRRFVARESERAIQAAFRGDPEALPRFNAGARFEWYYPVPGAGGGPVAVLHLRGNRSENFREYPLGS